MDIAYLGMCICMGYWQVSKSNVCVYNLIFTKRVVGSLWGSQGHSDKMPAWRMESKVVIEVEQAAVRYR